MMIGGYAVAYYGYPRLTQDFDIWVKRSPENAVRISRALVQFGFPQSQVEPSIFLLPNKIHRMGHPPNRIELMAEIDGADFDSCMQRRVTGELDGVSIPIISLEDLKTNKKASGRLKDLNDLAHLP